MDLVAGTALYVVAEVDLRAFVADWVADLEAGGGQMRGLLEHAEADPHVDERYEYGAHYLFANIGPRATEPTATPEELLLFAVMAIYQDAGFPGADRTVWDGEEAHVRRAFVYFHEIGERRRHADYGLTLSAAACANDRARSSSCCGGR